MTRISITCVLFVGFLAMGCGAAIKAPVGANGQKVALSVLFDRGLDGKTEDQANQLNQLSDYMVPNLMDQLKNAGYDAVLIEAADAFQPAADTYLLSIKLTNYNPGSKAARMVVGFGAGSCSLDLHYELKGQGDAPMLSKDHGRASSNDWDKIARELNRDILIAVTNKLSSL